MEKRIGAILILVNDHQSVSKLNSLISEFNNIVIGRQGIPLHDRKLSVITLIVDGENNTISSLTGQIGRLNGIQVKSVLSKVIHEI